MASYPIATNLWDRHRLLNPPMPCGESHRHRTKHHGGQHHCKGYGFFSPFRGAFTLPSCCYRPQLAEMHPVLQPAGCATSAVRAGTDVCWFPAATMAIFLGTGISPGQSLANSDPKSQVIEICNSHCCDMLTGTTLISDQ